MTKKPATVAEIREWARAKGYPVGDRGRLPADLIATFTKKTRRPLETRNAK